MNMLMTIPNNVHQWYEKIKAIPTLSIEKEHELFNNYKKGCLKSRDELLHGNIRNVYYMAVKFRSEKEPVFPEIMQEGCIGLLKSLDNFDTSKGVKLITLAKNYILDAITTFLFNNRSILKDQRTRAARVLYYNLGKHHDVSEPITLNKAKTIAEKLNENKPENSSYLVTTEDVISYIESAQRELVSLDAPIESENDSNAFYDIISSNNQCPLQKCMDTEKLKQLAEGFKLLNAKEQEVFNRTISQGESLVDVAKDWGVSFQRVGYFKNRAIKKLREHVTA